MSDILTAAAEGNAAAVEKLLAADPHAVNSMDDYGWSPLHFAANECRTDVVELLLDHGAKVFARNSDGFTPMHLVVQQKEDHPELDCARTMELLRKHASPLCPKCGEHYLSAKRIEDDDDKGGRIDFDLLFCSDCGHVIAAK